MKSRIARTGNSQGIHPPKALLKKTRLGPKVELRAEPGRILISKAAKPRAGWAEAAQRMRARDEDGLLDSPTSTRFEKEEWKWR
ncbi:MAG: AbrB/MazE/SpoVT family DNA-binding domain-containing protein [Nitrospira sp. CG24A]|nr:MAG: AbrB/MazE/SpoVT family DNA-binding domain-containing protein [Nitrospira sp. CG24A]